MRKVPDVVRWGGPPQQLARSWYVTAPPAVALAQLRATVAAAGGRVTDESERSLTARFGSRLAFRLFGPVFAYSRRRCPAVVELVANPQADGCQVAARAEAAANNYFHAKITTDLYDTRLAALLDALEAPAQ